VLAFLLLATLAPGVETPEPFEPERPPPPTSSAGGRDGSPPSPAAIAPILRRRSRGGASPNPNEGDDILSDKETGRVRVDIRADGSAQVDVPRPFSLRGGICAAGLCLGTRGARRQSRKPVTLSTAPIIVGFGGAFGYAPASTTKAREYLAFTRERRVATALAWQRRQLAQAAGEMSVRLAALLHDDSLGAARRRAIVFELWDDAACAAERPIEGDTLERERVDSAAQTRAKIERFVQRWLPQGSALGFSAPELARLNARRCSSRPFRPYETTASAATPTR
jgi:hypothetical protein